MLFRGNIGCAGGELLLRFTSYIKVLVFIVGNNVLTQQQTITIRAIGLLYCTGITYFHQKWILNRVHNFTLQKKRYIKFWLKYQAKFNVKIYFFYKLQIKFQLLILTNVCCCVIINILCIFSY